MLSPTIPPGINYLPTFPTPCACSETPITWSLDLGNLVICLHNAVLISQMQTKGRGWNCEVPRNMIWISLWGEIVWEYEFSFLVWSVVLNCSFLFLLCSTIWICGWQVHDDWGEIKAFTIPALDICVVQYGYITWCTCFLLFLSCWLSSSFF
jgi:hypothetical protein